MYACEVLAVVHIPDFEFGLFHIQSSYWERLVRSHYMMVIQASERMSNVDRSSWKIMLYTM